MIRKSLLWGLTVVLVAVLVTLIIRGRKLEKQQAAQSVTVNRQSPTTPTKVISPQDIEVTNSKMQALTGNTAVHAFGIRNRGNLSYSHLQLGFVYLDRSGRVVANKTRVLDQTVAPGAEIHVSDLKNDGIPGSAAECKIMILSADLAPESPGTKSQ